MKKTNKPVIIFILIVAFVLVIGIIDETSESGIDNNNTNLSADLKVNEATKSDVEKEKELEEAKKAEELKKQEAEKAEQERIAEANRLEEERKQREAEIAEANRIEAERIEEEKRLEEEKKQAEIEASNNFYVEDGTASHDHSTGYDSPYSDPNEPVITEEYGYVVSGNSYIHKTANCKFIRGKAATQVPVSSSGKASCNCWYY